MDGLPALRLLFDQFHEAIYIVDPERKMLYFNPVAETLSGFSKEEMEGTSCFDNKLNHIDDQGTNLCIHGCPLVESIKHNIITDHHVYMHHKDGHRIRVHVRTIPHHDNEGKVDGAIEVFSDASEKNLLWQEMKIRKVLTYIDNLTDVFNRHYLTHEVPSVLTKHMTSSIGVLFLDIDNLKTVNDSYGHHIGDILIRSVAQTLAHNLGANDIVIRYGGDEFLAILTNVDDVKLKYHMEHLLMLLNATTIRHHDIPSDITVKVSLGGTRLKENDTLEEGITRADFAMYKAKKSGKDQYRIY